MDRRELNRSKQATGKAKPKKAVGELEFSFANVGTVAVGVLAADATKAGLNAIFDVEPTNAQIMTELKSLRQENARLMGFVSGRLDAVAGSVLDTKLGLAASAPEIRKAIIDSENRQKNLPPPANHGH